VILIPEIPFDMDVVCQKIDEIRYHERRLYSLIVVAEGAAPLGGEQVFHIKGTDEEEGRLGGIAHLVGKEISHRIQVETRVTVLGHIQRGGTPTVMDRWLGSRFGANAVHLVAQEKWGYMVALHGNDIVEVPIAEAIANLNLVDPDSEPIRTARDLGISFGMPAVNNIKTP
jgi:6-phosphofructokinase 1